MARNALARRRMRRCRPGRGIARRRHDVVYVAEIASGIDDTEVLRQAQAEGRLLLTEDKGFSDLVFRSEMAVPGIVLLRISPVRQVLKWTRLEAAVGQFGERLLGRYLVIEEARLRSRPLLRSLRA